METISKKIIFFGTDEFSSETLKGLIKSNYNICAVVTKPDSKSGRGQKISIPDVKKIALINGIPVWQPNKLSDISDNIKEIGPDVAGILVSFGKIIPESIIELFNPGIINLHPSILPQYRGPSPIEAAIANGDTKTGITIMKLTPSMDAGPIYGQITYSLKNNETQPELYKKLAKVGADYLLKILSSILNDNLLPEPQDNTKASYCHMLNKQDSLINLSTISSTRAERLVRAHLAFPRTKINIAGNIIIITRAKISEESKSPIDVLCDDNKYLSIEELIAPSGKTMSAKEFINGYKLNNKLS